MSAGALSVTELHFCSFMTLKISLIDSSYASLGIEYLPFSFFFPHPHPTPSALSGWLLLVSLTEVIKGLLILCSKK